VKRKSVRENAPHGRPQKWQRASASRAGKALSPLSSRFSFDPSAFSGSFARAPIALDAAEESEAAGRGEP
jgi:hypothetical protein